MTRLCLIRLSDNAVIGTPFGEARKFVELPDTPGPGDTARVSPPVLGWQGGGTLTMVDGQWEEGPPRYAIVSVRDFTMPSGKVRNGPPTYAYDDVSGNVVETMPVTDAAVTVAVISKLTLVERLNSAGLLTAARAAIDSADLFTQERWNAAQTISADEPTVIAVLTAIGADLDTVLAPE